MEKYNYNQVGGSYKENIHPPRLDEETKLKCDRRRIIEDHGERVRNKKDNLDTWGIYE